MKPEIRIFQDICEIEPELWDSLMSSEDIQMSHKFVRLCQDSGLADACYWHLVIFDGGELQCVASLSQMTVSVELLSAGKTRATIRAIRKLRPSFLQIPVLFCGLPVSFGRPCLRMRPGANVPRILHAITSVMEEVARQRQIPLLCFKEFDPVGTDEIEGICALGYFRANSLPSCLLPLRWESFEHYIASTRAGYRRQIAGTLQVREASGIQTRTVENFGKEVEAIHSLYQEVMDRAPHQLERLNRRFFESLNVDLGSQSRAILLEREGKLLAAAILLSGPTVTTFLLAGIDYSTNRMYQSYPNLVLQVVAEAIDAGARHLEMGQTSYALKSRMGAQAVPRYIYLRHRGRVRHSLLKNISRFLFPAVVCPSRRVFRQ